MPIEYIIVISSVLIAILAGYATTIDKDYE